ncbi:hypothetical protein [Kineothrix sedimenti]|uniref:Uncharacterized protein n=1 Tax=Kineothrix sedimenti TaxID=3123317 RepID=A0ABZ3ESL5_9FIRM
MDSTKLKWCNDVLGSVDDAIQRIKEGTFNRKQQYLLMEVTGDLINALEDSETYKELVTLLNKIQEEFEVPQIMDINSDRIIEIKEKMAIQLNEVEKINYIQTALQLDVQSIMPLLEQIRQKQEEVRLSFQKAVDIDFVLHGKVSEITAGALEAFHFDVNGDKEVVTVAELPQVDKTQVIDNKKYKQYLKIPPQGKKQFQETVTYLNENGAKFDGVVKKWYITEEADKGKFTCFLDKASVIGKLSEKKKTTSENNADITSQKGTQGMNYREGVK